MTNPCDCLQYSDVVWLAVVCGLVGAAGFGIVSGWLSRRKR